MTKGGYLGSFIDAEFNAPLLLQLAEELQAALPELLGGHQLTMAWAFKYGNNETDWEGPPGIKAHADEAAINLNLWLSADDANLEDGTGGGLRVYTTQAPREWDASNYNDVRSKRVLEEFVSNADVVDVPHKQNRMVIFNSNLVHKTMDPKFRTGYRNRRINLTLLFGERCGR
jgi:hypothetical protein